MCEEDSSYLKFAMFHVNRKAAENSSGREAHWLHSIAQVISFHVNHYKNDGHHLSAVNWAFLFNLNATLAASSSQKAEIFA